MNKIIKFTAICLCLLPLTACHKSNVNTARHPKIQRSIHSKSAERGMKHQLYLRRHGYRNIHHNKTANHARIRVSAVKRKGGHGDV